MFVTVPYVSTKVPYFCYMGGSDIEGEGNLVERRSPEVAAAVGGSFAPPVANASDDKMSLAPPPPPPSVGSAYDTKTSGKFSNDDWPLSLFQRTISLTTAQLPSATRKNAAIRDIFWWLQRQGVAVVVVTTQRSDPSSSSAPSLAAKWHLSSVNDESGHLVMSS